MKPTIGQLFIPPLEAAFLKAAIESGSNGRAKRALQTLWKHYWGGARLLPKDQNGLENTILGALSRSNSDEKVRRWSLSALAQLGRPKVSWDAVISSLQRHQAEPQVVSAGIAAAFKLKPAQAYAELIKMDIVSPQFLAISALQTTGSEKLDVEKPLINIDEADVLAGTNAEEGN